MKIVKITYTARPEFINENKKNIEKVMAELKALHNPDMYYFAFTGPDGKTFMHLALFKTEDAESVLLKLDSFKYFQSQLKTFGIESPPQQEILNLVDLSFQLLNN